mgnify:CR=1 FL=1
MLKTKDILDEKDKRLRQVSKEVTFPLTKEDKETIDIMIKYLHDSQIDELSEKYDLRPGMGMSAVQLGILKRYFVVVNEISGPDDEKKEFETYILINPKIISNSMEQIYVEEGEGCLSINRPVEGIVPRYARVTMEAYDMEGRKIHVRAREELAICFQHELDHLNGILFIDHIDPKNPFKGKDQMRGI